MATTEGKNIVHEQANWTIKIQSEVRAAKRFPEEWGWMAEKGTRELSRATALAKYYDGASVSVKTLRVPAGTADVQPLPYVPPERFDQSPLSPRTAIESVVMSSSVRREHIANTSPSFQQTYSQYGSRLSLEQFGVSQHGIKGGLKKSW